MQTIDASRRLTPEGEAVELDSHGMHSQIIQRNVHITQRNRSFNVRICTHIYMDFYLLPLDIFRQPGFREMFRGTGMPLPKKPDVLLCRVLLGYTTSSYWF